jgi:plastocyanin
MRTIISRVNFLALAILASTLAACGGDSMGTSTPAPTASFSKPAQALTVNYGQAVTLTWASAYASSCTAMSSSAAAGTFTGSVSGSATVVPTAAGSYVYTLQCMGTGGSVSVATPTVTVQPSIISLLSKSGTITSIGSTIDPINGDQNPYGLTLAPVTRGLITAGDLVVCNFNDGPTNTQGQGSTIVGLHPAVGSTPYRIAQSPNLEGCNALAMLADDSISAAAWAADLNPLVSAAGSVTQPFAADTLNGPWGEAYVAATASLSAALYVASTPGGATNSTAGTIRRISLEDDAQTSITDIATGFCASGAPGAIFGPAGLTYDPSNDTLYIVDSSSNSVVAFSGVSSINANGIVVNGQCGTGSVTPTPEPTFSGPSASSARVIAHGAPLSTPLSAALLSDGNLVVGNADINVASASHTTNLLIEVSPAIPAGFVDQPLQLDSGAPGALFGIVATVDAQGHQIIYFNDDNAAAVLALSSGTSSTPPTPYQATR